MSLASSATALSSNSFLAWPVPSAASNAPSCGGNLTVLEEAPAFFSAVWYSIIVPRNPCRTAVRYAFCSAVTPGMAPRLAAAASRMFFCGCCSSCAKRARCGAFGSIAASAVCKKSPSAGGCAASWFATGACAAMAFPGPATGAAGAVGMIDCSGATGLIAGGSGLPAWMSAHA